MSNKIDIWSKGEVISYLQHLLQKGKIKPCKKLRLEMGYLQAFYPRCIQNWASRESAGNVYSDPTAYDVPIPMKSPCDSEASRHAVPWYCAT